VPARRMYVGCHDNTIETKKQIFQEILDCIENW
jgi:hypothetical protein